MSTTKKVVTTEQIEYIAKKFSVTIDFVKTGKKRCRGKSGGDIYINP